MIENGRPFVLTWRSAVLNSSLTSTSKLVHLALAEYADAEGRRCWPAMESIARLCSLNERTVRRSLEGSEWIARTPESGTGQAWRTYSYELVLAKRADTRTARQTKGQGRESAPPPEGADLGNTKVRILRTEGAVPMSDKLGIKQGFEQGLRPSDAALREWAKRPDVSEKIAFIDHKLHLGAIDALERERQIALLYEEVGVLKPSAHASDYP